MSYLVSLAQIQNDTENDIDIRIVGLEDIAKDHRRIAQKQLEIQESAVKQILSDKEKECLQLFRLTSSTQDATYEWYKDHVEARVDGTCEWFLNHDNFKSWLQEDSGPLLVSADPGCGKSVLAKYLIEDRLPRSAAICYFFFKDQDQNTVRQALCAILHQLLLQKPALIKYAMEEFAKDGHGLINTTKSLWTVLGNSVRDPQSGPIIIVLDALDECAPSEFEDLIRRIKSQLHSDHSGQSKLKYLLTSRPYEQIVCKFVSLLESFPFIRIPGEEESESISREVNYVIRYRVKQLANEKGLSDSLQNHLAKRLLEIPHRTYLWVYLVFDFLMTESFRKTADGINSIILSLPTNLYDAYERILNASKKGPEARRALTIVLAAVRPLTLSEMNIALNVRSTSKCIHDLDLEEDKDFGSRLRDLCGLFISIHHDKVYFLHQTAREFLIAHTTSAATPPSDSCWQHSIASREAHNVLAEICVVYLDFFNNKIASTVVQKGSVKDFEIYPFLDYSALNWAMHYREAYISRGDYLSYFALRICGADSKSLQAWLPLYWKSTNRVWIEGHTSLMLASYFGLEQIVMLLLEQSAHLDSRDGRSRTSLSWAAEKGHGSIVKLLLEKGAEFDFKDNHGMTPMSDAAKNGHESIVKLLLEKGAEIDAKGGPYGQTPLSWAAENGHESIVNLLLEKGDEIDAKDNEFGRTPLSWAAENGHESTVKLLLEKGAEFDFEEKYGWRPLSWAASRGHESIVKLLLEKGAEFDFQNKFGITAVSWAASRGHESIVKLLLEKGAKFDLTDDMIPLLQAAKEGHESIVKLFLEKGAEIDAKDDRFGRTPLSWATENGHESIVKLLLEKGAEFNAKDNDLGRTPLSWAASRGHQPIVKLLLEKGAEIESKDDRYGQTPLLWAAENGHESIVILLLEKGAELEAKDNECGRTPLSWAAKNGHESIVKLLLEEGAEIDAKDNEFGRTPLSWVAENGHESIVKLLLERGADVDSTECNGLTPLLWAALSGHITIVKLLLNEGANLDAKDEICGQTPLAWAAENGYMAIVQLLLEEGVDLESTDKEIGQTPLSLAAENGYEAIVKLLLEEGADPKSKDKVYGQTALEWAAENGHGTIVKLLLVKSEKQEEYAIESKQSDSCPQLL
jgi:ankyrin repeat protein